MDTFTIIVNSIGVFLTEILFQISIVAGSPDLEGGIKHGQIAWTAKTVQQAAKSILSGEKTIMVKNRAEAEELFLGLFQSHGFKNTTGMGATEVKNYFGKSGTYHWDDVIDKTGNLLNHASDNAHSAMKHLQVHGFDGEVIRIFFK